MGQRMRRHVLRVSKVSWHVRIGPNFSFRLVASLRDILQALDGELKASQTSCTLRRGSTYTGMRSEWVKFPGPFASLRSRT